MKKFTYELVFVNKLYDICTLYFKSYKEIFSFVNSNIFTNNVVYIISCYNYKTHHFIYNFRRFGFDD